MGTPGVQGRSSAGRRMAFRTRASGLLLGRVPRRPAAPDEAGAAADAAATASLACRAAEEQPPSAAVTARATSRAVAGGARLRHGLVVLARGFLGGARGGGGCLA